VGCDSYRLNEIEKSKVVTDNIELNSKIRLAKLSHYNTSTCDLAVNEKAIITEVKFESSIYDKAAYRLTHLPNKQFVVDFNPKFVSAQGSVADKKLDELMRNKTNKCFARANEFMLGPNDEVITLRLSEDREVPSFLVLVEKTDRAYAHQFSTETNCAALVHEYLHRTGLVDEYREKNVLDEQGRPIYNCRHVGPEDSIMSNHELRANQTGNLILPVVTLKGYSPTDFGKRSALTFDPNDSNDKQSFDAEVERFRQKYKTEVVKVEFKDGGKGLHKSLLTAAQFRAITSPRCESKNSLYFMCAANAYRTTYPDYTAEKFALYNGKLGELSCVPAPEQCKDPNWAVK